LWSWSKTAYSLIAFCTRQNLESLWSSSREIRGANYDIELFFENRASEQRNHAKNKIERLKRKKNNNEKKTNIFFFESPAFTGH